MYWLRPVLTLVALFVSPLAAQAQELRLPHFEQCISTGPEGVDLIRTTSADPTIGFVATTEASLAVGRRTNLATYLTRKGDGAWRLWVVFNFWSMRTILPPAAELVIGGEAGSPFSVQRREQGDFEIFEIDPVALLDAHPDKARVVHAFRERNNRGGFVRRRLVPGEIDLARLRSLLTALPDFDRADGTCVKPTGPIDAVVDPVAYNECRITTYGGDHLSVWFVEDSVRIQWQPHLSRIVILQTDQWVPAAELQSLLAQPVPDGQPGILGGRVRARLVAYAFTLVELGKLRNEDQARLSVRLTGDWGATADLKFASEGYRTIDDALEDALMQPGDLTVSILGPTGTELDRSTLPAGSRADAEMRVRQMLGQLGERLRDPMANCQTPYTIVVT